MADEKEGFSFNTPFGPVVVQGAAVFVILALIVVMGFIYFEMGKRTYEHNDLEERLTDRLDTIEQKIRYNQCLMQLSMFVFTHPPLKGWVDYSNLPFEVYSCLPKFLMDDDKKKKEQGKPK